jgi:hypothetical protein
MVLQVFFGQKPDSMWKLRAFKGSERKSGHCGALKTLRIYNRYTTSRGSGRMYMRLQNYRVFRAAM